MDWISVKDDMPKEYDNIYNHGTELWAIGTFRRISNAVLVTFESVQRLRITSTGRTINGKWETDVDWMKGNVTHWMPFPEPAKGE